VKESSESSLQLMMDRFSKSDPEKVESSSSPWFCSISSSTSLLVSILSSSSSKSISKVSPLD
jgi:hypothetical protein